jgi:nucleoside-diphosphate-sugar epimerase
MSPVAFVAGATGYTGREVVRTLVGRGIETAAHIRPDSPQLGLWRERFAVMGAQVDATPWQVDALAATFARWRPGLVFALLGTTRRRMAQAGGSDSYESVDYGLTVMLIEAAVRAAPGARFVHLSAIGVREGLTRGYLGARSRAEAAIRASGMGFTIARPSFITGRDRDEDRPVERLAAGFTDVALAAAARLGARRLADRYHSTTNVALADALVRRALDPSAANRTLEGAALFREGEEVRR